MAEEKTDKQVRQEAGAKRKRGNFVSVYKLMTVEEIAHEVNAERCDKTQLILVQVIDENAACKNNQEARKEASDRGITGTLVASRRCGTPWERVEQTIIKDVEVKNMDGFNEVHKEDD